METATVIVAPAPVAITQPPQHKLMELKFSFAPVAKSFFIEEGQAGQEEARRRLWRSYPNPLQYFVKPDETVAKKIVVHKSSVRGTHFWHAGPRRRVYYQLDEVRAAIVTCGGLCLGLNTVIRELVCDLHDMYGITAIYGIEGGYKGFYARNAVELTLRFINGIHKRGGTMLGTSHGGQDTAKIIDSIQDRGVNQVYIIGSDGS
ncbi:unnamed protein product [Miscanthus lutarioriparius]|uniref:Phosphofructokinase domain-containing protein n=1 Tax=Miscanthus lutarioriparius TaxID=422564 RepID=A0A811SG33_9POAL|nr:unnamed protein product [Miscanthus lutarioriparius]